MSDEIKALITESTLDEIGDAIRSKNGEVNKYYPSEMPAKIRAIPQEGGSVYYAGDGIDITNYVISVTQALRDTIAGKADSSALTQAVNQLTQAINGKSAVSVDPKTSTGTLIAEIDVDGTTYSIYAPSGGAGDLEDLGDVVITTAQDGDVLKYDSQTGKWVNAVESGGTVVVANPTGTPTDTLNTIDIDGTIYEIVGGGGSSEALVMKELTYIGTGTTPLVVEFDEVPVAIFNIFGAGINSNVISQPFYYGADSFLSTWISPNPWSAGSSIGGGTLLNKVSYSNDMKTMTVYSSAGDTGAHWNQTGDTYTVKYLVEESVGGGGGGASAVSDLTDVDLNNLSNGQVLKYNSTTQKWENANESGGTTLPFDVVINSNDNGIDIVYDDGT